MARVAGCKPVVFRLWGFDSLSWNCSCASQLRCGSSWARSNLPVSCGSDRDSNPLELGSTPSMGASARTWRDRHWWVKRVASACRVTPVWVRFPLSPLWKVPRDGLQPGLNPGAGSHLGVRFLHLPRSGCICVGKMRLVVPTYWLTTCSVEWVWPLSSIPLRMDT